MAAYWQPTAAYHFGHVPKGPIQMQWKAAPVNRWPVKTGRPRSKVGSGVMLSSSTAIGGLSREGNRNGQSPAEGKRQLVAAQAARVAILDCQFHGSSSLSRLIG